MFVIVAKLATGFELFHHAATKDVASNQSENPRNESRLLNIILDGVTPVPTMRKPFDVLAEGLVSENSRDDKTAIELFLAGIREWEAELRRWMGGGTPG